MIEDRKNYYDTLPKKARKAAMKADLKARLIKKHGAIPITVLWPLIWALFRFFWSQWYT